MYKKSKIITSVILTNLLVPFRALAAATDISIIDPGQVTIADIIVKVTTWVLSFTGAVAVLFIIYSGLQYITAGGDAKKAETAKSTLTYAIIGLIVVILANVIVVLIKNTIGTGAGGIFSGTTTTT